VFEGALFEIEKLTNYSKKLDEVNSVIQRNYHAV
jgi:hypothetical protein